mmetsp:Transcript_1179/g.3011  ORF Transcript_1179/g.3011 Transcript_1179/m.3011 type:complete len:355 (-) Transcript_1179:178-1242(-)
MTGLANIQSHSILCYISMTTFNTPLSLALRKARRASSSLNVCWTMRLSRSASSKGPPLSPSLLSSSSAMSMGPHLEPTTTSSSITMVDRFRPFSTPAAQVDFSTSTPRGIRSCMACSKPFALPVASMATSHDFAAARSSPCPSSVVESTRTRPTSDGLARIGSRRSNLLLCLPMSMTLPFLDPSLLIASVIAAAMSRPSFPSPSTATVAPSSRQHLSRRRSCSTTRSAAARGSAKTASSSGTTVGTMWRFLHGSTTNSWKHPGRLRMPSTVRLGQWLRFILSSRSDPSPSLSFGLWQMEQGPSPPSPSEASGPQCTLMSAQTRFPTNGSRPAGASTTIPTNSCPKTRGSSNTPM